MSPPLLAVEISRPPVWHYDSAADFIGVASRAGSPLHRPPSVTPQAFLKLAATDEVGDLDPFASDLLDEYGEHVG